MTKDLNQQLEELRQLFEQGVLTEETYRSMVAIARAASTSIDVPGSGAVAKDNSVAAGEGGTAIGGDVTTGKDFVGRDKIIQGDEVHGNKIINEAPPDPAIKESERAERRYLENLFRQCNSLPLASLGDDNAGGDVTLDQVYIELDTTTRVEAEGSEGKRRESRIPGEKERAVSALEAAQQTPRLALLGEAGSGKSSFVRQLIAGRARERLKDASAPIPVFTYVRDLPAPLDALELEELSAEDRAKVLVGAVWEHWEQTLAEGGFEAMTDALRDSVEAGNALLVFDGLDEVPHDARLLVREAISALLNHGKRPERTIVTSRTRSYTEDVAFTGFRSYTLAPFSNEQIGRFVSAWYNAQAAQGVLTQTKADARADDLRDAVRTGSLRELAENPMLLTTMSIIHQREVGLPDERVKLYAQAVEVLIYRWQRNKGLAASEALQDVLGDEEKLRTILERLAYEVHAQQAGDEADLPRGELLALLEAPEYLGNAGLTADFLDYVDQRAGLFIGRGGSGTHPARYAFAHRTFGEYLAGCYLLSGRGQTILRTYRSKVAEGDYWYLAAMLGAEELVFNKRRPTELLDLMYALCPTSDPESETEWRSALWSGQMATLLPTAQIEADEEQPEGGKVYLARVRQRLLGVMRESALTPIERAEAGKALAKLGDTRINVLDPLRIEWCEVPAGEFTMGGDALNTEGKQFTYNIPYAYRMARYPVTNAQFTAFVEAGGYQEERYWPEAKAAGRWSANGVKMYGDDEPRIGQARYSEPFNLPTHPVGVSWYEALAFTRWLTERMRESGQISKDWEIRLPNEPEWEKAARGTDGRVYPWGDDESGDRANYDATEIGATNAVGCFPAGVGPFGCEEMGGNIWEWTRSVYADYPYPTEPTEVARRENLGAGDRAWRVLRGGSFGGNGSGVRCVARSRWDPLDGLDYLGFRVIAAPIPLSSGASGR